MKAIASFYKVPANLRESCWFVNGSFALVPKSEQNWSTGADGCPISYYPYHLRVLLLRVMPKRATESAVRERVLEAGVRVFAEYGYDATTTRDIAVAAACGEPSVYRLFGSKGKLFAAVIEHAFSQLQPVEIHLENAPEVEMPRVVERMTSAWASNPHVLRLFYWVGLSGPPKAKKALHKLIARTYENVMRAIDARKAEGTFRTDPPTLAMTQCIVAMLNYDVFIHDLLAPPSFAGTPADRDSYRKAIAKVFLEGVRTR